MEDKNSHKWSQNLLKVIQHVEGEGFRVLVDPHLKQHVPCHGDLVQLTPLRSSELVVDFLIGGSIRGVKERSEVVVSPHLRMKSHPLLLGKMKASHIECTW